MPLHSVVTPILILTSALFAGCRGAELPSGEHTRRESAAAHRAAALPDSAATARMVEQTRRALVARRAGDAAAARAELERAGEALEPVRDWVEVAMLQAAREAGDSAEALAVAERLASSLTGAPASVAWAEVGRLRAARGDSARALEALRRAMEIDAMLPGALDAARQAVGYRGLTSADHRRVGEVLLAHGGTERGTAQLASYLSGAQGTPEALAPLHARVGRGLFLMRRYAEAERHLRVASPHDGEAALLLGRTLLRSGSGDAGVREYRAVAERYAGSATAAEAYLRIGDLALDADRREEARAAYRSAIETAPATAPAAQAAARLAADALGVGDARATLALLERQTAAAPTAPALAPAWFWSGRLRLVLGDETRAREDFRRAMQVDPYSYYGVRAAERIGSSLASVPLAQEPPVPKEADAEIDRVFWRVDVLRALALTDAATGETALLRSRYEAEPAALARIAREMAPRGQPIAAGVLARDAQRRLGVWSESALRVVYPFPYRDIVVREARRNGLDPFVVAGLIRQESYFSPVAVSGAGAVGLMQVMPETGRQLASAAGVSNYRPALLSDPDANVRIGTRFLAAQMRRWNGREDFVFAAYNAGPSRVQRWRLFPEQRDAERFIERIPFEETRDYVKQVSFHAAVYRRLYGSAPQASSGGVASAARGAAGAP
jgi:soluble lytic murein transglycosylase